MQYGQYRLRVFLDFSRCFVLPCLAFASVLHVFELRLGLLSILGYPAFIISWTIARIFLHARLQEREMRRLGARPIPCVIGKWPGNIDILLRMLRAFKTSYILDVYLELFKEYQCTTLNTRILWMDNIITMDQEHIKFVLATGFQHFWRGYAQKERMETFLGSGIFNRDDEIWKMHRNMAKPFFARERISDFEVFEKYSAKTLAILSSQSLPGRAVEVQDLFGRFTLDAASEFLFGRNVDTLSGSLPRPGQPIGPKGSATYDEWGSFATAFEKSQQIATERGRLGSLWPLFELGDRNAPHAAAIRAWLDPLVQQALKNKEREEKAGIVHDVKEKNFLQHLADCADDPVLIRDQLLSVLLASRDTTACLLTFVIYFLANDPGVGKRLRAEVLERCGPSGTPTYEQIRNLKYMRAVLNETLRLFPPVPLNVRESRSSAVLLPPSDATYSSSDPRPLYMPASTTIMYFPLLFQRNPALWGGDADEFNPDRWLESDRLSHFLSNPTIFAPFSSGPRICIGQNYAYNEASYFLIRLLQQFDTFSLAEDLQPKQSLPPRIWKERSGRQSIEKIWPASALTLFIKGGLWVRMSRASS